MKYAYYGNELYHHGIKGQKWGVRRYQYADGTLTPAGREHRGFDKSSNKRQITNKIYEIANSGSRISKQAESYITGKNLVDSYIKSGTNFSRIQTSKDFDSKYAFYAAYKKHDVDQYQGLFGKNLKARAKHREDLSDEEKKNVKIYKLNITAQNKIKIPSDENASHITANLIKDPEFKENLRKSISDSKSIMRRPQQQALFDEALAAIDKDKLSNSEKSALYKALNLTLTNHNEAQIAMQNKFYDELKKKGYSAIIDVNDKEFSSYHSKRPMIVFDTDKVTLQSVAELDDKKVDRLYKRYNTERIVKDGINQVVTALPSVGKMSISRAKQYNKRKVDSYLGA